MTPPTWTPIDDDDVPLKPLPAHVTRCLRWIELDGQTAVFDQRRDGRSYIHVGDLAALLVAPERVAGG
jgi:hypothetical protein